MLSTLKRIIRVWISYAKISIPAGILGGSLAGIAESIVACQMASRPALNLVPIAIMYYGMVGAVISFVFAFFAFLVTGLAARSGNGRFLDYILFSATATALAAPFYFRILFKFVAGTSYQSPEGLAMGTLLIYALFLCSLILFWIFRRLVSSIRIKWQWAGLISYVIVVAILTPTLVSEPATGDELFTYNYGNTSDTERMAAKPYIFFIIVDALRHDWLSSDGYNIETPNILRLADDGIVYANAFSQCSWTKPSIASMMTSLYPGQHKVETSFNIIDPRLTTMAQVISNAGYYTVGFHNNDQLRKVGNFHLGFNHYEYLYPDSPIPIRRDSPYLSIYGSIETVAMRLLPKGKIRSLLYQNAEKTCMKAIDWLSHRPHYKSFMFLHFMEPHQPYFYYPYTGDNCSPRITDGPEKIEEYSKAYQDEIRYFDKSLGMFLQYLDRVGIYDSSMIMLTADHGEEFYEHKGWTHGQSLYDELIHIPMIMKLPFSKNAGSIDSSIVRAIDIAPTLADMAGGKIPESWEGRNMLGGKSLGWSLAQVVINSLHSASLRYSNEKIYIRYDMKDKIESEEYFKLIEDPQEKNNLAGSIIYAPRIAELTNRIDSLRNSFAKNSAADLKIELDEETQRRLKALGYLK